METVAHGSYSLIGLSSSGETLGYTGLISVLPLRGKGCLTYINYQVSEL